MATSELVLLTSIPNTGTTASATNALLGVVAGLTGLGLVAKRRKRDDEE